MFEVLLLEHDPVEAQFIIDVLNEISPQVHVEWVSNTRAALDFVFCTGSYARRISDHPLKLILLDVTFSDIQGIELLGILKSYAHTRVLPIVALTTSRNHSTLFAQANSCVVKTSDRDSFRKSIELVGTYWLMMNQSIGRMVNETPVNNQSRNANSTSVKPARAQQDDTASVYG